MKEQTRKMIADVAVFALSQVVLFYGFKYILGQMDPTRDRSDDSKRQSADKLGKLGRQASAMKLNQHEERIATELILPDQIDVDFNSIGGLDHIISSLQESVIAPLRYPELFRSSGSLLGAPKGVLLFGPPGTGKTMLAKALAKESGATFINMHVSTMMNKWFGESNKLVSALFSLAAKLQPTIIFIDEIDSFMRSRAGGDHEATNMMKAEFMTLWDGLTSATDRIMILGATNRPNDIDAAILRRMPKRYAVGLPNPLQREKILRILLKEARLEKNFSIPSLVKSSEGMSGSDLKEACRNAAMRPVREYLRSSEGLATMSKAAVRGGSAVGSGDQDGESVASKTRPLRTDDFFRHDDEVAIPPGQSYNHTTNGSLVPTLD